MNNVLVGLWLTALTSVAFAECDSMFVPNEPLVKYKAKLECLATQVTSLREELISLQKAKDAQVAELQNKVNSLDQQLRSPALPHIGLVSFSWAGDDESCKSKASEALQSLSRTAVTVSGLSVYAASESISARVVCRSPNRLIITAGSLPAGLLVRTQIVAKLKE